MLKIRKGNAYAWLVAFTFISMLFIGYYIMIKPVSLIYDIALNDPDFVGRGRDMLPWVRSTWLYAGLILAVSLIIWVIVASLKKDYQQFPGG